MARTSPTDAQCARLQKEIAQLEHLAAEIFGAQQAVRSICGYDNLAAQCDAVIGGTATKTDTELIGRITEAAHSLNRAEGALVDAEQQRKQLHLKKKAELRELLQKQQRSQGQGKR